ncbi:MAG TPA: hypothetical protein VGT05_03815 [Patescibacteria group bacterium]|nr:hypothetical protein [Patescibacteria group bacterium]
MTTENSRFIGEHTVFRNQEALQIELGLGLYSPQLVNRVEMYSGKPDEQLISANIWLPSETNLVMSTIERGESTLIMGDPGSGKSTLIYGIRVKQRVLGSPYYFIDGHYQTTDEDFIFRKLRKALKKGAPVIWDSFDYLVGKSKKVRKSNLQTHIARSRELLQAASSFIDQGGILVGTSHSAPWLNGHGEASLVNGIWSDITEKMYIHNTQGIFENQETLYNFLKSAAMADNQVHYLVNLFDEEGESHAQLVSIAQSLIQEGYTQDELAEALLAVKRYKNLKLLSMSKKPESLQIRHDLEQFCEGNTDETAFLRSYLVFNIGQNRETKKIMRQD